MGKTWKVYFSFSSLLMASLLGVLTFIGIQKNEQSPIIITLAVLSSLIVFTLIFFLLKVAQKKPRHWIRIINKTLLVPIILLTLFSLGTLISSPENFQKADIWVNLFLLIIALWSLFASVTLVKLLAIEQSNFESGGIAEIITSIDKKVDTFGNNFVKNHTTIAGLIALAIIVGISMYLYVILGIPIGSK